jgi:hypothetical protein
MPLGVEVCQETARPLLVRALQIRESRLGPDHLHAAASLSDLGTLFYHMGDYEVARPVLERALQVFDDQLGPDHPHTQTIRRYLALLVV